MSKIEKYHGKKYYIACSVEEYLEAIRFIYRNELLKDKEFDCRIIDGKWVIASKDDVDDTWVHGPRNEWERLKARIYHMRQKKKGA